MNNNNNKNNSDGITTKKGFLISLPSKKKGSQPNTASSINMAKTVSSEPHTNNTGSPSQRNLSGKQSFDRNHNNNGSKDNSAHKNVFSENTDGKNEGKNNKHNLRNKKRHDKHNNFHDNKNDNRLEAGNVSNIDNSRKNTNNKAKKHSRNDHSFDSRPDGRNDNKNNKKNRNDRRNNQRNHHNFDNNIPQEKQPEVKVDLHNNQKNPSISPLAPISSELSSFSKSSSRHRFTSTYDTNAGNELPLEEKYKNAIPLAQQIEEANVKARHPMTRTDDTEKQEIIGVRFREAGKIYYFDPNGIQVPYAAPVIVETARGPEYGFTAISNRFIPCSSLVSPLKKIVRLATMDDTRKYDANKALEKDGAKVFREKVEKLGLEMNLIYVEYTFDNSKLLFYFTAESRVDFRELVKELAGVFKTRIELRQMGVRDEAKVQGGLGICGRATCCSTFLGDFAQVSIKMAKDQSLSLNAAKISGVCGKLMCCLRYEDKVYEQENARTPKVGSLVETPEGKGTVTERNTLKGTVKVSLESEQGTPAKLFTRDEVKIISHGKAENDSEHDDNADEIKDED